MCSLIVSVSPPEEHHGACEQWVLKMLGSVAACGAEPVQVDPGARSHSKVVSGKPRAAVPPAFRVLARSRRSPGRGCWQGAASFLPT